MHSIHPKKMVGGLGSRDGRNVSQTTLGKPPMRTSPDRGLEESGSEARRPTDPSRTLEASQLGEASLTSPEKAEIHTCHAVEKTRFLSNSCLNNYSTSRSLTSVEIVACNSNAWMPLGFNKASIRLLSQYSKSISSLENFACNSKVQLYLYSIR